MLRSDYYTLFAFQGPEFIPLNSNCCDSLGLLHRGKQFSSGNHAWVVNVCDFCHLCEQKKADETQTLRAKRRMEKQLKKSMSQTRDTQIATFVLLIINIFSHKVLYY